MQLYYSLPQSAPESWHGRKSLPIGKALSAVRGHLLCVVGEMSADKKSSGSWEIVSAMAAMSRARRRKIKM